ncbi:MAG TPA: hypothetical protein DIT64_22810 [Verrucomicrobiales bacterium]|nr:hypothetical protein [Verrucomicrobiales bacterium]HRK15256.1 DMT family transporter [Prosthecobacter sp.]
MVNLRRGSAWMLLSLAGFTGMALLVRHLGAERGVSAWWALFFRAAAGMAVVWAVFAPGGRVSFRRALRGRLLVTRGVLGALGTAAYYVTLPVLGAGKATLIGNTWAVWAALFAAFMLGEKLAVRKLAGIVLAVAGVALLTGLQGGDLSRVGGYDAIALAGAFAAAFVVVVIRQLTLTETSGTIFASQCIYAGALALPFLFSLPLPGGLDILLLTAAALLAALGQLAMTEGFRYLPVSTGGAFQILLPLVLTVAGVLFFDETFTLTQAAGAACILSGCHLTVAERKS